MCHWMAHLLWQLPVIGNIRVRTGVCMVIRGSLPRLFQIFEIVVTIKNMIKQVVVVYRKMCYNKYKCTRVGIQEYINKMPKTNSLNLMATALQQGIKGNKYFITPLAFLCFLLFELLEGSILLCIMYQEALTLFDRFYILKNVFLFQ